MKGIIFHLIFIRATVFLSVLRLNVRRIRQKGDDELHHGRKTNGFLSDETPLHLMLLPNGGIRQCREASPGLNKKWEPPRKIISLCRSKAGNNVEGATGRREKTIEMQHDERLVWGPPTLENAGWRQRQAEERHPGLLTTLAYKLWFLIIPPPPASSILFMTFFSHRVPEEAINIENWVDFRWVLTPRRHGMNTVGVAFNLSGFRKRELPNVLKLDN